MSVKNLLVAALMCCAGAHGVMAQEPQQNPARPYIPAVYDSRGKLVGPLISDGLVLFELNGVFMSVHVDVNGFSSNSFEPRNIFYTSSNCTGTQYLPTSGLPHDSFSLNGKLYFANDPIRPLVLRSYRPVGSGTCTKHYGTTPISAGPLGDRSLTNVGDYTAPFTVKRP